MYTLDTKKHFKNYLMFSIIVLVISIIYESFSHNVYSSYMLLSFLIPLIASVVCFVFYKFKINIKKVTTDMFYTSVLIFTFGSFIKGVLDIYGTTNSLIYVYLVGGIITLLLTIITLILKRD